MRKKAMQVQLKVMIVRLRYENKKAITVEGKKYSL